MCVIWPLIFDAAIGLCGKKTNSKALKAVWLHLHREPYGELKSSLCVSNDTEQS